MSVMPELHASTDLAGQITAQAARDTGLPEGTPVFCGCGDGTAASVGTGISKVGQAYMCLGTSAWISYLDDAPFWTRSSGRLIWRGSQKACTTPSEPCRPPALL